MFIIIIMSLSYLGTEGHEVILNMVQYDLFVPIITQAVNKLDEALQVSGLAPQGRMEAAIDLGAAPGAWSMFLASMAE